MVAVRMMDVLVRSFPDLAEDYIFWHYFRQIVDVKLLILKLF